MKCSTPIPAEVNEVAWVCRQCGQGMALNPLEGLQPLQIFYSAALPPNTIGKPFWVSNGMVALSRETYRSDNKSAQEAMQFWGQPRRFFLPAFQQTRLDEYLDTAISLLVRPPALQPGPACAFQPVTLFMEDIQPATEFIVMAIEAGRKDQMKNLRFEVKLDPPALWILP
jgi:hypothetical protein